MKLEAMLKESGRWANSEPAVGCGFPGLTGSRPLQAPKKKAAGLVLKAKPPA
jgi:hypothetical protein